MRGQDTPGVPLHHYREHQAGVRLTCRTCKGHRDLELEAVIERLQARGVGGANTGIIELAKLVKDPCPACGGTSFETAPAFGSRAPQAKSPR